MLARLVAVTAVLALAAASEPAVQLTASSTDAIVDWAAYKVSSEKTKVTTV